jgi:hypothetical protein
MGCCRSHVLSPNRTSYPSQTSKVYNLILEITKFCKLCNAKELKSYSSRIVVAAQSFFKSEGSNIQLIYDSPGPRHIYVATSTMFMPTG